MSNSKKVVVKTNEELQKISTVNSMERLTDKELNRLFVLEIKNASTISKSIFSKFKALKNDSRTFTNVCTFMVKKHPNFKEPFNFLGAISVNDAFKLLSNGNSYNYQILGGAIKNTYINYGGKVHAEILPFLERSQKINTLLLEGKKETKNLNELILEIYSMFDKKQQQTLTNNGALLFLLNNPFTFLNDKMFAVIQKSDLARKKALSTVGKSHEFKEVEISIFEDFKLPFKNFESLDNANKLLKIQSHENIIEYATRFETFQLLQQKAVKKLKQKEAENKPTKEAKILQMA